MKQRASLTSSITPSQKILPPPPLHLSVQSVEGEREREEGERGDEVGSEPGRSKELERERDSYIPVHPRGVAAAVAVSLFSLIFLSLFFVDVLRSVCRGERSGGTLSHGGRVRLGEGGRGKIVGVRKPEASRPTWTLLVLILSD